MIIPFVLKWVNHMLSSEAFSTLNTCIDEKGSNNGISVLHVYSALILNSET